MLLLLLWEHAGREPAAHVLDPASPDSTLLSFICMSLHIPVCISNLFSHLFLHDWLGKIEFCAQGSMLIQYSFLISSCFKIPSSYLLCNILLWIQHSETKPHRVTRRYSSRNSEEELDWVKRYWLAYAITHMQSHICNCFEVYHWILLEV